MAVEIGKLSDALVEELKKYTMYVAQRVKDAADETANELLTNIRREAPKRTGKYKRAMSIKTKSETAYEKRNIWYVKKPRYRLTHLLENGHRNRNSGFTRAYPHIRDKEQAAKELFEEKVKEIIKNGL